MTRAAAWVAYGVFAGAIGVTAVIWDVAEIALDDRSPGWAVVNWWEIFIIDRPRRRS